MCLSWIQTISPSRVLWKSPSIASAPCSQANWKAGIVFSGASRDAPRWATIRGSWLFAGRQTERIVRVISNRSTIKERADYFEADWRSDLSVRTGAMEAAFRRGIASSGMVSSAIRALHLLHWFCLEQRLVFRSSGLCGRWLEQIWGQVPEKIQILRISRLTSPQVTYIHSAFRTAVVVGGRPGLELCTSS